MTIVWLYRCDACGHLFAADDEFTTCPACEADCESFDYVIERDVENPNEREGDAPESVPLTSVTRKEVR